MNTLSIVVKRQKAFSSTNNEGFLKATKRAFWCVFYLLKGVRIGIKGMGKEQIGSQVIYEGKRLSVSNWSGRKFPTLCGDGFYKENVPRAEIKNVLSLSEYWHRFKFMFNWYMAYWHDINVNEKIR